MWYTDFGKMGDVVLSSRVRLARNLADIPFDGKMTATDREELVNRIQNNLAGLKYIDVSTMSDIERISLYECHLISPDMAKKREKCGVLLNDDCTVCVMVGEEDHIRIQAMSEGLELEKCYAEADRIDDELEKNTDYAFDEKLGYLTHCLTNVGTGMRASVMVHLPALYETGGIDSVIRSLSKIGVAVRGIYGEGSRALGKIYQISNQVTLGMTENEIVEKLTGVVNELVTMEREAGRKLYEEQKIRLEDRVLRAFGVLTNSKIMSSDEAMNLISDVRWGINLGIIKDISLVELSTLMYDIMPGNIMKKYNITDSLERDLKRSELSSELGRKQ